MGKSKFTYKQKITKSDFSRYIRAVSLPILIFALSLISIQLLEGFGSKLVAPLTALMICGGVICAIWLPSHRSSILKETYITVGAYLLALLAFRQVISMMAGVSSEMFMETFNQTMPVTSGSAISGWLQNLMWISAVMTPIGFIGMQGKRVFTFKRKNSKERFMNQTRGYHKDEDSHLS